VATCARPTFHALLFDFPQFFRSAGNVKLFAVNVTIAVCRCWKMCCCVVCRLIKSPKHLDRFRIRRPPPIRQMRDTRYQLPDTRYICANHRKTCFTSPRCSGALFGHMARRICSLALSWIYSCFGLGLSGILLLV